MKFEMILMGKALVPFEVGWQREAILTRVWRPTFFGCLVTLTTSPRDFHFAVIPDRTFCSSSQADLRVIFYTKSDLFDGFQYYLENPAFSEYPNLLHSHNGREKK